MSNFISAIHLNHTAEEKLTQNWFGEVVGKYYFSGKNVNLLDGKNVDEIQQYATGDIKMAPFVRMFDKNSNRNLHTSDVYDTSGDANPFRDGLKYESLAILPNKLNSAIALTQKIPVQVKVKATDGLASKKKNEDVNFLRNKPIFQEQLQALSDQMNLGRVDLGSTRYSATPFSNSPYGLDLNEPDEAHVFTDVLYNLAVEASFRTGLKAIWDTKQMETVKVNWLRDQLYYGVHCHSVFQDKVTGLPDVDYVFPGDVECPESDYPDFRDIDRWFMTKTMTITDLFSRFGDEIGSIDDLDNVINGTDGYCQSNKLDMQKRGNYDLFKVTLKYVEIKSVDWIGVIPTSKSNKYKTFTTDEKLLKEKGGSKRWFQNTYGAWWLFGTNYFYGITRLGFAHREIGKESYQSFSLYAFKSAGKSAVELSIKENKKAIVADLKLQYAVWKAKKDGMYIDLKFLRGAESGLKDDPNYSRARLIKMALEDNDLIGDTDGFDGQNEGQFKPFQLIPGGLGSQIEGYMRVIADAYDKIGRLTGINEQLTGQEGNPLGLVGMQQLMINGSANAMYYMTFAFGQQVKNLFANWAHWIKVAVEGGGAPKQAIVNLIGSKKVGLIDAINDFPLHQIGIFVKVEPMLEEEQRYQNELFRLKQLGIVNTVDEYMLSGVEDADDRMALLAVKYKQFEKKQERQRQEQMQQQQAIVQQQGQNQQAAIQTKSQADQNKIFAQGQVSANILRLASQLGIGEEQVRNALKKELQQDRSASQLDKSVQTLETKHNLEMQKPYGS